MPSIALITDSDCSLPASMTDALQIQQVPIRLHLNGTSFEAGVDLDDQRMFQLIEQTGEYPKTAAPSPEAFASAYQKAIDSGAETVICICVSSAVSATYNAAVMAADMVEHDIRVVDSLDLSLGQGFIVLEAEEVIQQGGSVDDVLAHIESLKGHIHTFAVLPSLKFVALSGRLGKLPASIADTFNIKPILSVQDGKLEVVNKQRTLKKATETMLAMHVEAVSDSRVKRQAFIHSDYLDGAQALAKRVNAEFEPENPIFFAEFTPGLSVHTGPGVVGVATLAA